MRREKTTGLIMPAVSDEVVGGNQIDDITLAGRTIRIARPKHPEALLDLNEVASAYDLDEYMPYWATIWPVCLYVAEIILREKWHPGRRAIELGCGLGVPGVAAMLAGLDTTFSDYDETALRFAGLNAQLNGCANPRLLPLDLRAPLAEQFDLVIASDMIYESRFVGMLVNALKAMLAPGGEALIADQNRAHAGKFCDALKEAGFVYELQAFRVDKSTGWEAAGTIYRVRHQ